VAFLVLYVDEILLIRNNVPFLNKVKDYLKSKISMENLGEGAYILRIKIYRDRTKYLIGLSQDTYLDKVVKRFQMENSKGMMPMITGKPLSKAQHPQTDKIVHECGTICFGNWVNHVCYDIYSSWCVFCSKQTPSDPRKAHWVAVKRILSI
jgi:hypothetical protein